MFYTLMYPYTGRTYISEAAETYTVGESVLADFEFGKDTLKIVKISSNNAGEPTARIIRKSESYETSVAQMVKEKDTMATTAAKNLAKKLGLKMDKIQAHKLTGENKIVVLFTSRERIDFREFVKAFAQEMAAKILMHQTLRVCPLSNEPTCGVCGRPLCCQTIYKYSEPPKESPRLLKDQGFENRDKMSGLCDKLMCCLHFEQKQYEEARLAYPREGDKALIDNEIHGAVSGVSIIKETVTIKDSDGEIHTIPFVNAEYNCHDNTWHLHSQD